MREQPYSWLCCLVPDKSVFVEQLTEAATLPLNKLIEGIKIGGPLCRVGGKIQLVIRSRYAFGANTSSTLFFPNSFVVFELAKQPR